ncbi:MAG: thioredoxin [Anaerolineae bacterium]|jgi:thioredoxin 1
MLSEPINVTDAAFDRAVLAAGRPVMVIFWSRQDDRAEQLRQTAEATAQEYAGALRVARLEAGDASQTRARYEVDALPEFLFFRDGQLVARARGYPSRNALRPWIEYLLGSGPPPAARQKPAKESSMAEPVTVSDATFDQVVLQAGQPVLVDFWAAWCGPCRVIAPVIERLAAEFAGRAVVAKLDVEANPTTARRYGAMSIPTLIFFQDGQEVDRLVGAQPEGVIRSHLQALV